MLRKVLREVIILRKLSEIDKNIYTTKIIDIILPLKCQVGKKAEDGTLGIPLILAWYFSLGKNIFVRAIVIQTKIIKNFLSFYKI